MHFHFLQAMIERTVISFLYVILSILSLKSHLQEQRNFISEALNEIFIVSSNTSGIPRLENWNSSLNSIVRRRCANYISCEYFNPMIELHNIVILDGNVLVRNPDRDSENVMHSIESIYGSRVGYLPAFLGSRHGQNDF